MVGPCDDGVGLAQDPAGHRLVAATRRPRRGGRRSRRRCSWRVCRTANARTSRLDRPTIGTPSTCASVFAVSTPTRRPVNRPGPMPTAIAADLRRGPCRSTSAAARARARPPPAGPGRPPRSAPRCPARSRWRRSSAASRSRCRRRSRGAAHGARAASRCSARSSHDGPVGVTAIDRSSSPLAVVVSSIGGGRRGSRASTASPHSTSSSASPSPSSSSPRSTTSCTRSSR